MLVYNTVVTTTEILLTADNRNDWPSWVKSLAVSILVRQKRQKQLSLFPKEDLLAELNRRVDNIQSCKDFI